MTDDLTIKRDFLANNWHDWDIAASPHLRVVKKVIAAEGLVLDLIVINLAVAHHAKAPNGNVRKASNIENLSLLRHAEPLGFL